MKKILLGAGSIMALFSLSVLVFPSGIQASMVRTNTGSWSYSKTRATTQTPVIQNKAEGYRGIRPRPINTTESSFSDQVLRRAVRNTARLRKTFSSSENTSSTATRVATHGFLANEVSSFFIELPDNFEKTSDTLTAQKGSITFTGPNTTITISPLGNICDGGTVFVQDCLNKQSDKLTAEVQQKFPAGRILKKEVIQLRETGEYRFDKANAGKWFFFDAGNTKRGILTFFDPEMKYLWNMDITSTDKTGSFLNNAAAIVKMRKSLFQSPAKIHVSARVIARAKNEQKNRVRSGITLQRQTMEIYSSKDSDTYTAREVPFTIRIPKGFSLVSDTITHSSGSIQFQSPKGSLEIRATDAICSDQSFSVERTCIEKFGAEEIQALKEAYPNMTSLGTENYRLQLTTDTVTKSVGRGVMLMSGSDRVSTLVFAEPSYGNMWQMNIVSHAGQNGLLGNAQQLKSVISSLRFQE